MTVSDQFGLPRYLGDGLLLRWARPDDADELASFNVAMHSDKPEEPETWLGDWTRILMAGDHPTTRASDFTVVFDEHDNNRIISSIVLISQAWRYEEVAFGVGRPELVATHPDYRRRGLVREQMNVIHALSASRGEMLNAITGIPWYYRQFDYEMTVNLHGSRKLYWSRHPDKVWGEADAYTWRAPVAEDLAVLTALYDIQCARSLLVCLRAEEQWRFEIKQTNEPELGFTKFRLIEDATGVVVGYCEYQTWGPSATIRELAVLPGVSWRAVCLWLAQRFQQLSQELVEKGKPAFTRLSLELGEDHPAYDALGTQLEPAEPGYAWYLRVPDLPGFLMHVAPVLERRLAENGMAGYSSELAIDMYTRVIVLTWRAGKLTAVRLGDPEVKHDRAGRFRDLTFLHLLFGHRTLDDLEYAWVDCRVHDPEARVLFEALFPRKQSCIIPVW